MKTLQVKTLLYFSILILQFLPASCQLLNNSDKFLLPLEKSFLNTTKIVSKEMCCPYSYSVMEHGPNTQEKTIKFTLLNTDSMVNGGVRSELAFRREPKVKVERWYGFDIFLPEDYVIDSAPEALAQWHEVPDFNKGENWRSPPISLWTQGKHWYLHILWSADIVNTNKTAHTEIYDLGELEKGKWIPWIFHIKFSWEADGQLEIWQHNKKIFEKNGPNAYNDEVGNYFKIGIYKWVWNKPQTRKTSLALKREVYYKNISVGNEKQTYNTFSAK